LDAYNTPTSETASDTLAESGEDWRSSGFTSIADMRRERSVENSRDGKEEFQRGEDKVEDFQEDDNLVIEDEEGNVLGVEKERNEEREREKRRQEVEEEEERARGYRDWLKRFDEWRRRDEPPELAKEEQRHRRGALAYQFGNT